jgi:energy-coupling factor transporter ATP-binding protein EcfA2
MRIEAHGWGWRHAGRAAWALRGLDLAIDDGERVLLLGPSGAGKSTLLAALAGLLDPSGGGEAEGSLLVDGRSPRSARDATGLLLQDPESQLVMGRSGDDVAFGLENRCVPTEQIWSRVDAAFEAVGFHYGRDHPTHALSGGEQQRLALAGTLALWPSLLLLDEPTAILDTEGASLVVAVLRRVLDRIGATMLLVEHRVDAVVELVDRVVVLEAGGGVVADGAPWQVFARHGDELLAAYARAGRDVASLEKKLRYAATQSQLVQDFARLARRHGVKIVSETYEETRGPQPSLSAELAVQGDYPALRDFVRDLSVLPTWSEVQEVRLESAQGAASQRGRIRIVTYRQAPADTGKPS